MSPPLPVLRCSSSGARRPLLPANVAAEPRRLPGHMTAVAPRPVELWDPDWFLGDDVHRTFSELRRTDPVHWQDMPGEAGFWAVLRYADAVEVARQPERYSSWRGGIMLEDVDAQRLESTFDDGHRMDDVEFGSFFVQLVTAGNDTTKTLISSGMHQLL